MTREEMDKFIALLRTYDEGAEPAEGWWVAYNDLQKAADALEWFKSEFIASCKGQHEIELRLTAEVEQLTDDASSWHTKYLRESLERERLSAENRELRSAIVCLWAGAAEHDLDSDMTLFVGGIVADAMNSASTQQGVPKGQKFTENVKKCIGNDPLCPCQDGDMCHYEGPDAWPIPDPVSTQQNQTESDGKTDVADPDRVGDRQ